MSFYKDAANPTSSLSLSVFTTRLVFPRHRLLVIAAANGNFVVIIRNTQGKQPCVYPLQKPLEKPRSREARAMRDFRL